MAGAGLVAAQAGPSHANWTDRRRCVKYDLVFEGGGAKGMVFVGALQSVGWVKPVARPNTLQYGVIFCWVSLRSTQPTAGGSGAARRSKAGAMAHLRRTKRSAGVRLLDEWGFFHRPEPRLARIRWMRPFESLFRTLRIYHFQLGEAEV